LDLLAAPEVIPRSVILRSWILHEPPHVLENSDQDDALASVWRDGNQLKAIIVRA
jgi:hypothetical protein